MLGFVTEIGTSALRLWVAAGSAASLLILFVLAFFLPQAVAGRTLRSSFVIVGAVLGGTLAWALLGLDILSDRSAERRSFELRAEELNARALVPGSPLACLDALAGETLKAACEKTLFASPANVAAASSYVAEQLTLLTALAAFAKRANAGVDDLLLPLRRSLEADRFGFLAHVLATRNGCSSDDHCSALALLNDPSRVRANLRGQALDRYLDHYLEIWARASEGSVADAAQTNAPSGAPAARKMVNIDFPTAASIPPVSIMTPEPTGPVLPGMAAAAAANPNPQQAATPTSRRVRKPAATPSTQTVAQPTAPAVAATEPIWPEPVPLAPSQTVTAPVAAPLALDPPLPSANARTQ
jgi:hypothetical protein